MLKRSMAFIVVLGVLTSLFAGCAGSGSENGGQTSQAVETKAAETQAAATEAPAEKVTLKVMETSAFGGQEKTFDEMVQEFQAKNPGITVKYEIVGWRDYYRKLNIVNNSSNGPDVFEVNYENFKAYSSYDGVLTDLTNVIANDKDFGSIPYKKIALDAFNYNGKQYGVGVNFSDVIMYYNKDLFDAKGVKYPDASWTWKDELAAAQKITDPAKGIIGTHAPIQFYEFYKTIAQNGGGIWGSDGKTLTINSKQNVEALQWMLDKGNKYKVDGASNDDTWDQADYDLNQFIAGKLGMMRAGTWSLGKIKDEAKFNWDIALEPGNTQKAHHVFIDGMVIAGNSKLADAGWKFLKFMSSDPFVIKKKIEKSWGLSVVDDAASMDAFLKVTPPASKKVVIDALDYAVLPPVGPIPTLWSEYTAAVGNELTNAKLLAKTPQQALDDAQKAVEALMK